MALKAEVPLLNYLKVSLKCKREEAKEKTVMEPPRPVRTPLEQDGARTEPVDREWPVSNSVAEVGREEPSGSWREEYLIAKGRPVCMVCGDVLSTSGPEAAREHILQQHSHSLDFTLEEKRNILEAWSEESEAGLSPSLEVALLSGQGVSNQDCREREPVQLSVRSRQSLPAARPGGSKKPAEIEVLLDSEEQPEGRKRGHLKARYEATRLESRQRSQSQQKRLGSASSKDMKLKQVSKCTGKVWPSEGGLPGSAPAEIRIFTDGSFPAGFALKLYCRTQPERSQDSRPKPDTRKERVDRDCSVSLLRLHSTDSSRRLCPSQAATPCPLGSSAGGNVKDCRAKVTPASKKDPPLLSKSFNPSWRARFLMDYDPTAGQLLCMVCESPLRRICLATVKRHILQCHAETLHLPREVRRTIREVWETRAQSPPQAGSK
ncbi:spindlin interactor and repressor of chromatin-binding protein [Tiliqua scincoides]|uniref:spindlin interactor and repressor of chromatin-binding protein n=1 Tax=Tiliqua scincoides TaxID=71010 RepID=UPI003461BEB0